MAKDNRVIRSAVNIGGEVYGPGREDDLEAVMTKKQLKYLTEQGALEGDFTASGKAAAAPAVDKASVPNGPGAKSKG